MNEFFPESEETQNDHIKGQRQGMRSTGSKSVQDDETQDANAISILTSAANKK